jgi:hypothetical protein
MKNFKGIGEEVAVVTTSLCRELNWVASERKTDALPLI